VRGKDTFRRSPTKVLQGLQRNGLANFLNMECYWYSLDMYFWACVVSPCDGASSDMSCKQEYTYWHIGIIGVAPNEAIVACSNITFMTVLQHITM
jgi:hypothetical protein